MNIKTYSKKESEEVFQEIIINGTQFKFPKDLVDKYIVGNSAFSDSYTYEFPQDHAETMADNLWALMNDNENNSYQKLTVNGTIDFLEFIDKLFNLDLHSYNLISNINDDLKRIAGMYTHSFNKTEPENDFGFNAEFNETYKSLYTDLELKDLADHSFDLTKDPQVICTPERGFSFWATLEILAPERIQEGIFKTLDAMFSKGINDMKDEEVKSQDFSKNLFNFISYNFFVKMLPEEGPEE